MATLRQPVAGAASEPVWRETDSDVGGRWRRLQCGAVFCAANLVITAGPAFAGADEGDATLLLPIGYGVTGAILVIVVSLLLVFFTGGHRLQRLIGCQRRLCRFPIIDQRVSTSLSAMLLIILVVAGFIGSRDPSDNPLPLAVWTIWWVGFVLLQALFGDLWSWCNPWVAPNRLLSRLIGQSKDGVAQPLLPYPEWLGLWPAILAFFDFAWFEIIYPTSDDPFRLAVAVLVYGGWTLCGMTLFGEEAWLSQGEPFSIFLALVARLSPFSLRPGASGTASDSNSTTTGVTGKWRNLYLVFPGSGLLNRTMLAISGTVFLLLVLSAMIFDGLSSTYWWDALIGVNPLELPGRNGFMDHMTLGLLGIWLGFMILAFAAIRLACGLVTKTGGPGMQLAAGKLVPVLLPIGIAYHLANSLPDFLIDTQNIWGAISDPFEAGWNLFGTSADQVNMAVLTDPQAMHVIWVIELAIILLGQTLSVILARQAVRVLWGGGDAVRYRSLPLTVVMTLYSLLGLWLLTAQPGA
jgi:hypothetical protein